MSGTITITLSDGTQLTGLKLNGNNFVSPIEVTAETFKGKLGRVTISGDAGAGGDAGLIGEHENMELVQIAYYTQATHGVDDGCYFVLRDIPTEELENAKRDSDIAYMAMMMDIDLEK